MSKTQRIINYVLWGVLVVVVIGMIVGKFIPPGMRR